MRAYQMYPCCGRVNRNCWLLLVRPAAGAARPVGAAVGAVERTTMTVGLR